MSYNLIDIVIRDALFGLFINWLTETGNRLTDSSSVGNAVANSCDNTLFQIIMNEHMK